MFMLFLPLLSCTVSRRKFALFFRLPRSVSGNLNASVFIPIGFLVRKPDGRCAPARGEPEGGTADDGLKVSSVVRAVGVAYAFVLMLGGLLREAFACTKMRLRDGDNAREPFCLSSGGGLLVEALVEEALVEGAMLKEALLEEALFEKSKALLFSIALTEKRANFTVCSALQKRSKER